MILLKSVFSVVSQKVLPIDCQSGLYQEVMAELVCVPHCTRYYQKIQNEADGIISTYTLCVDQCVKDDNTPAFIFNMQCLDKCPDSHKYFMLNDQNCYLNCPSSTSNPYCPDISKCTNQCDSTCLYYKDEKQIQWCLSDVVKINGKHQPCSSVAVNLAETPKRVKYFQIDVDQLNKSLYSTIQIDLLQRQCLTECQTGQFRVQKVVNKEIEYKYYFCDICEEFIETTTVSSSLNDSTEISNQKQCVSSCNELNIENGQYQIIQNIKQCAQQTCSIYQQQYDGQLCLLKCEDSIMSLYQFIDQKPENVVKCVSTCPPKKPFLDTITSLICQETCVLNSYQQYENKKVCQGCASKKTTVDINNIQYFQCFDECPHENSYFDVVSQLCLPSCKQNQYLYINKGQKECLNECPKQLDLKTYYYQYDTNDSQPLLMCMDGCENEETGVYNIPKIIDELNNIIECTKSCPTSGLFIYQMNDKSCQLFCPTGTFAQGQKCVTQCDPIFTFVTSVAVDSDNSHYKCVASCPDGYVHNSQIKNNVCQICTSNFRYDDKKQKQCVSSCATNQFIQNMECVDKCDTLISNGSICLNECLFYYEEIDITVSGTKYKQQSCLTTCGASKRGNTYLKNKFEKLCIGKCETSQFTDIFELSIGIQFSVCLDTCHPYAYDDITKKCSHNCYFTEQGDIVLGNKLRVCTEPHFECVDEAGQHMFKIQFYNNSVKCVSQCDVNNKEGFTFVENFQCKQTCENTHYYQTISIDKDTTLKQCVGISNNLYYNYDTLYSLTLKRAENRCDIITEVIQNDITKKYKFILENICVSECPAIYKKYYDKLNDQYHCLHKCPSSMYNGSLNQINEINNNCIDDVENCITFVIDSQQKKCFDCRIGVYQGKYYLINQSGLCLLPSQCSGDFQQENNFECTPPICSTIYKNAETMECYENEQQFIQKCSKGVYYKLSTINYCATVCPPGTYLKKATAETITELTDLSQCVDKCNTKFIHYNNTCIDQCGLFVDLTETGFINNSRPPYCRLQCPFIVNNTKNFYQQIIYQNTIQNNYICLVDQNDCYQSQNAQLQYYTPPGYINQDSSYINETFTNITYSCVSVCHTTDIKNKSCQTGCSDEQVIQKIDKYECQNNCQLNNLTTKFQAGQICTENCPHNIYYEGILNLNNFNNYQCLCDISQCKDGYYYVYKDVIICRDFCRYIDEDNQFNNISNVRLNNVQCADTETVTKQCPYSLENDKDVCKDNGCNQCVPQCIENFVRVKQTFSIKSNQNRMVAKCQTHEYCRTFDDDNQIKHPVSKSDGYFISFRECVKQCSSFIVNHEDSICQNQVNSEWHCYFQSANISFSKQSKYKRYSQIYLQIKSCDVFELKYYVIHDQSKNQKKCLLKCPDDYIEQFNEQYKLIQCVPKPIIPEICGPLQILELDGKCREYNKQIIAVAEDNKLIEVANCKGGTIVLIENKKVCVKNNCDNDCTGSTGCYGKHVTNECLKSEEVQLNDEKC